MNNNEFQHKLSSLIYLIIIDNYQLHQYFNPLISVTIKNEYFHL